jgi:3-oxoacyl-[acyl-carrier protein] reductase
MDLGLRDKVILVTGAASGFGEAATRLLAGEGAKLALCDIDDGRLARVADRAASTGSEAASFRLDVAAPEQTRSVVAKVAERFGRIDGMLHFAGVIDTHSIEDTSVADWNRVIGINLHGTFLMVQAVAPAMRRTGGGRIVLTASDSARKGATVSGPAYAASKGGVIALTRDFAMKLGPSITVNAICPGVVMTPMVTGAGVRPEMTEEIVRRTPLQRLGNANDMAEVAVLLVSETARFINGEIVEINGGFFFD